ncbi:uncharacterized protein HMPREF1541_04879 [Cyphellophora europaea CBS 101466]|uniref:FAD-binding FR-type domain-containing protein n=1 Tax=Cyphellophora europaea (strain CBS 101466) TaxID=1220924 RepID=W2RVX2_CYPE1|nr:uncharacterized protein HMPREF1541_04879 [Cyphellophora europaea CBS 101466]ETN40602.1 hypothetical protein HMPREF1541_04879 [Cyphellophora europaea CBS 101466]
MLTEARQTHDHAWMKSIEHDYAGEFENARAQLDFDLGKTKIPPGLREDFMQRKRASRQQRQHHEYFGDAAATVSKPRRSRWRVIGLWFLFGGGALMGLYGMIVVGRRKVLNSEIDSPTTFRGYKLMKKERVSSTASIFHLNPMFGKDTQSAINNLAARGLSSFELKQPQIQVVRAYTPLPENQPSDETGLRFLVRHEPNGEVSSWLHRLPLNSQIEMRGPQVEVSISEGTQRMIFLAGGTGIAPALQAASLLLRPPGSPAAPEEGLANAKTIHILWACRRREDCEGGVSDLKPASLAGRLGWFGPSRTPGKVNQGLIVQELEAFKTRFPGQVSVSYFVDEESTFITEDSIRETFKRITPAPLSTSAASTPQTPSSTPVSWPQDRNSSAPPTQVFVSGPDGFVGALAGPKVWAGGREEQGPLRGILGKLLLHDKSFKEQVGQVGVYKI